MVTYNRNPTNIVLSSSSYRLNLLFEADLALGSGYGIIYLLKAHALGAIHSHV